MEHDVVSPALMGKIGAIVEYVDDLRLGKRDEDKRGLHALLDDPEVANWLTTMKSRGTIPRRFVGRTNGGW